MSFLAASAARADITSWLYAGGGIASAHFAEPPTDTPPMLSLELGAGSAPDKSVIVGALFKTFTFFGDGTDIAQTARVATGGFVRGGFGLALDAGVFERFWRDDSVGFAGGVVLGAPYGIQLSAMTEQGSNDVRIFGVTVGVDLLRLTVYRTSGQNYWPNPFPASGLGAR